MTSRGEAPPSLTTTTWLGRAVWPRRLSSASRSSAGRLRVRTTTVTGAGPCAPSVMAEGPIVRRSSSSEVVEASA